MSMIHKKVIRCQSDVHIQHTGNILVAIGGNSMFVKCGDRGCKRWTKISISIPGIKINFSEAGIVQEVMPEDYHLHLEPATTAIGTR